MSDADIINAIYAERSRTNAQGAAAYFKNSTAKVQHAVLDRFESEQLNALRALAAEQAQAQAEQRALNGD
jgi:hypothetical protein